MRTTLTEWIAQQPLKGCPCLLLGRGHTLGAALPEVDRFVDAGGAVAILNHLVAHPAAERATTLFALDAGTFRTRGGAVTEFAAREGRTVWTHTEAATRVAGIDRIACHDRWDNGMAVDLDGGHLYYDWSTAHFALQVLLLGGAPAIWTAGIDLRLSPDGETHADGMANLPARMTSNAYIKHIRRHWETLALVRDYVDARPRWGRLWRYDPEDWSLAPLRRRDLRD